MRSFSFTNVNGCDSVVTIEVSPKLALMEEINLFTCDGGQVAYNDTILLANSRTEFSYITSEGCDSIITVNVEISAIDNSFLGNDQTVCGLKYTLNSPNNNTFWNEEVMARSFEVTTSGTYIASFMDERATVSSPHLRALLMMNTMASLPSL